VRDTDGAPLVLQEVQSPRMGQVQCLHERNFLLALERVDYWVYAWMPSGYVHHQDAVAVAVAAAGVREQGGQGDGEKEREGGEWQHVGVVAAAAVAAAAVVEEVGSAAVPHVARFGGGT